MDQGSRHDPIHCSAMQCIECAHKYTARRFQPWILHLLLIPAKYVGAFCKETAAANPSCATHNSRSNALVVGPQCSQHHTLKRQLEPMQQCLLVFFFFFFFAQSPTCVLTSFCLLPSKPKNQQCNLIDWAKTSGTRPPSKTSSTMLIDDDCGSTLLTRRSCEHPHSSPSPCLD